MKSNSESAVKTDEKKQHFDDIYIKENPVPYKERILDELEYISDNFNRQTFDRLILPWVQEKSKKSSVQFVDLCGCFGNTSMAILYGMDYDAIRKNWEDETSCKKVQGVRRFPAHNTGIDLSSNALDYGKSAGIYDATIQADLNQRSSSAMKEVESAMEKADVMICTAGLVYLDPESIGMVLEAFSKGEGEGYILVNFLNPFALEKSDETKRLLLKHLEFVGSTASRHRKMSALERSNYPGEEWSLLELWVLKRK